MFMHVGFMEFLKSRETSSSVWISGLSGLLFKGEKIRTYQVPSADTYGKHNHRQLIQEFRKNFLPNSLRWCQQWAVVTTIFKAGDAVRNLAKNSEWCLVVVPDVKSQSEEQYNVPCFYFKESLQEKIFPVLTKLIPKNHFGRKNLGFLLAYTMGAERVWDFDDDNDGMIDLQQVHKDGFLTPCKRDSTSFNPYKHFGTDESFSWPRGLPLNLIQDPATFPTLCSTNVDDSDVFAYQSLANLQPDVDGIYRLTRKTPFDFLVPNPKSIVVPTNVYTPFNAQATLWNRFGFPLLFLPCSVHARVSDIWRSYFTQHIVHNEGSAKKLVFTKPYVVQDRNVHNYLADFNAELPLYEQATALVEYLSTREYEKKLSLLENILKLYIDLYERGYLEELDVKIMHRWSAWMTAV